MHAAVVVGQSEETPQLSQLGVVSKLQNRRNDHPPRGLPRPGPEPLRKIMNDLAYILMLVGFFAIAGLYVQYCAKL
jgi:hypothetical protein